MDSVGSLVQRLKTLPGAPRVRRALRDWKQSLRAWRAERRRARLGRVRFIAVTGSAGKTTTTRLLGAILATTGPCTVRSHNNTYPGIVTSLLKAGADDRILVQEMSGERPGAIANACRLLRPEIGIVTRVGGDHRAAHRTLEAIAMEKGRLVEALPATGLAVLNADDPSVKAMAARSRARVVTFGRDPSADVVGTDVAARFPDPLTFVASHAGRSAVIRTQLFGEVWLTPVLAALACAIECGVDLAACARAIAAFPPVFNRYSRHLLDSGADLILDTEKATWWTLDAGLAFVASARASRKTIVIGSLADYPTKRRRAYAAFAREALKVADRLVFTNDYARHLTSPESPFGPDRLLLISERRALTAFLNAETEPGELVYVKGNRPDRLAAIVRDAPPRLD